MKQYIKYICSFALIGAVMLSGCSSKNTSLGETSSESAESTSSSVYSSSVSSSSTTGSDSTAVSSSSSSNNISESSALESTDSAGSTGDVNSGSSTGSSAGNNGAISGGISAGTSNGSSNGGGNNGGTSSNGGLTVEWSAGNSWEENGNSCGSAELKISNTSGNAVSSWNVSFTVPNGFTITSSWNGNFSVSGTTVKVTNADYNGNIPAGGSVTAGFNYASPTAFTPNGGNVGGTNSGTNGGSQNNQQNTSQNTAQNNTQNNSQNNSDKNQNDPAPSEDVAALLKRSDKAVQGDDWLHTDGNKILDKNGKEVWITGVNWFGYNTGTNTFDGLWNSQLRGSVKAIADHGFNLIRVPISAELLNQWSRGEYPKANYNNASNPELNDMNSLQIFDYFLKLAEENGMKVMPDIHCAETNAMGHNVNLWYTDKVSVEDYYHALEWLADRYKDNDTIIAIDIKNEPHGKPNEGSAAAIWNNSTDKNNWKYTAEQAAARILAKNPNVLIMVEGTEIYSKNNGNYSSQDSEDYYFNWWGGNLRGVRDYPVNLGKYQNKLVYSPHDYGPTVYEQPWFKGDFTYESLKKDCWQDNWLYIQQDNIAPLLIGEWGGFMREPNLKWMTYMRQLIKEYRINHTFWCYNANSGDTGGLVLDDFTTWDTEKYNFVKEVLWQENGKFVGLDHEIPLGVNGISL